MTVRALVVSPGGETGARLVTRPEPVPGPDEVLVDTVLVGICGTDREIVAGAYGTAPADEDELVIGHEALGIARTGSAHVAPGDLVVPIVRRPDPVPCASCAAGEWDMCRNGRYTEHGIRGLHGFATDRFVVPAEHLVVVPPELGPRAVLVEPASVVAKAWEQIDRIADRASWQPRVVLVTGAGPVGLLAALLARQRGLETHVLDRVVSGPKPQLVADLGAEFHTGTIADSTPSPDVVVECTGVGGLVLDAIDHTSPSGIVCLTGLSSGSRTVELDATALNRRLVLENDVVFGTVNANRRHYAAAVAALAAAEPEWLDRLVTRRVPLGRWSEAIRPQVDDVKVALDPAG